MHSFVPAALEPLISQGIHCCDVRPNYWEQTSPAGLSAYVDILESTVKPYLNSRLGFLSIVIYSMTIYY